MNENLRQLADEINRRFDEVEAIEDFAVQFNAHIQVCTFASRALRLRTEAELIEVIETQSVKRPDPVRYDSRDTPAAWTAAGVLGQHYCDQAQKMDTAVILDALAPLTGHRDPAAASNRAEGHQEDITAPDALRREALVSVLTDRYDTALSAARAQDGATPRRDRAAAVCRAVERQLAA